MRDFSVIILALLLGAFYSSKAQSPIGIPKCATMEYLDSLESQYPDYESRMLQLENDIQELIQGGSLRANLVQIPIVVHVIYNTSAQNISDVQIQSQITVLNEDFRRISGTPGYGNGVDTQIEFYLAQIDPNGNPTNGITRTNTSVIEFYAPNNNMKYTNLGGKDAWPTDEYLNIWVCNLNALGFAQFPNYPGTIPPYDVETDGVVVYYGAFGNTGVQTYPGYYDKGRTATHEIGHWLGLRHIWGDVNNCNGTDYVDDTPPCSGPYYSHQPVCFAPFQCGYTRMIENYMDYSDDLCYNLFTQGQSDRMHAVLETVRNTFTGGETVTIDQKLSNGTRVGSVKRWVNSTFKTLPPLPAYITPSIGATEVLLGDQAVFSSEKYNNWNLLSDVKNHHSFVIDDQTDNLTSNFLPTYSDVTIKNEFLEYSGFDPSTDNIDFKDPWFIDYEDPVYGNTRRNRGMQTSGNGALLFRTRSSPFSADFSTGYEYGQKYNGAFRNQSGPPLWTPPYYSVRSLSQDIFLSQTNRNHRFYLYNWSGNNVSFQYPYNTETAVVFTNSNATAIANLKGTQLSSQSNAYSNNSQRKFVRSDDGVLHSVYESLNRVWYEYSPDNGSTWLIGNSGQPLDNGEGKQPSIDYSLTHTEFEDYYQIFIVFQEKSGSSSTIKIKYFQSIGGGGNYPFHSQTTLASFTGDYYAANATPVICSYGEQTTGIGNFTVVWKRPGNLLYARYGYVNVLDGFHLPSPVNTLNGTTSNSINPTLYSSKSGGWIKTLAWEESGTSIKYATLSGSQISGSVITLSSNTGFSQHYSPSIIEMGGSARVCWVGFRMVYVEGEFEVDSYPQYKVLFKSPQNPGSYWQFGNNVSSPNINKKSDNTYYAFAWSEDLSTIKFADNTLSTVRTISDVTGQNLQINNGPDNNNMFCMAFEHNAGDPFYFERSNNIGSYYIPSKITNAYFSTGREGTVSIDSAAFYFALGDISVDGETIDFIDVPDTVSINNLNSLNEFLITEPFIISDNSNFIYSVQFGLNDSLSALQSMTGSRLINFKVHLIDNSNSSVLGEYDNITYNSENLFQYNNLSYQVNTQGIGNRTVRLKLIVDDNFDVAYSLSQIYADTDVLGKAAIKQISFTGGELVTSYDLAQNFPNPFNPSTIIKYQIPQDGRVSLKIYDILGKEIKTLVNEQKSIGRYEISFNASDLASGVYIYRIQVNDYVSTKKMMLLK